MELDEAIGRIAEIRAQVARTETFRGYRSLTVGLSGMMGIVAAVIQAEWIPQPTEQLWNYVDLWAGVAILSLLLVGSELAYRYSVTSSLLKRRLTVLAIQQFVPCLVAGALMTLVIAASAPQSAWMLPGLWALLFSLGVFASCQLLPQATFWIGVYYMASGVVCLATGNGSQALSPWMMVGTFGVGQFLAAAMLYYTLERNHEQIEA